LYGTFFNETEGFKEAAEKFQQESGISPSMELDSLDDRIRIRDAIQSGRIQEATALVNQLHPELLDNDRYLYFHLQVMHLTPIKPYCSRCHKLFLVQHLNLGVLFILCICC
jgi:hypothetical protein